jgi:hypothetical protein
MPQLVAVVLLPKPTVQIIFASQNRQQDFGEPSA